MLLPFVLVEKSGGWFWQQDIQSKKNWKVRIVFTPLGQNNIEEKLKEEKNILGKKRKNRKRKSIYI